ncbi:LacI family DNA-binding transcriptional regulator [Phycicoccus sp. CSK15P-2]|uniref:LacI family DNA-binding transcriptional regulator n=1 Tax=Phycicoccus sp. CSK15P-2 TaxID=2807627 RepID=UPI001EF19FB5|nr:LacI family DNA-binding transcriptional regulator [Phycicoccus sp. CSK15P-2]
MRDVAALAGVSLKTVSRVVNDEPGVSDDVRTRVQTAVARLDYRPNLAASNLRRLGARTGLIGALVQDLSNSFSAALLRALEDAARTRRTGILTASLDEEIHREQALVHDLVTRRVDALVLMPSSRSQEYLAAELRTGTPAVFVDRPPRGVEADSVVVDNAYGARLAAEHLLDQGHRRIAGIFHLPQIHTAAERMRGFTSALTDAGLEPDPHLMVTGVATVEATAAAVRELLDLADPPTAIFAARNNLAVGAVRAIAERGLSREVALVGFDDFPMSDLVDPPLTVIRQDVPRIGRTVADLVFQRIEGDRSPVQHVVLNPSLLVRGSGEIPPRR